MSISKIRLDRFSPNFEQGERRGLRNIRPAQAYRHIYPLDEVARRSLARYFEFDYGDGRNPPQYSAALKSAIEDWKDRHDGAELVGIARADELIVWDTRGLGHPVETRYGGLDRLILEGAESILSIDSLTRQMQESEKPPQPATIAQAIERLENRHLLLREGSSVLSLVVRLEGYVPRMKRMDRLMAPQWWLGFLEQNGLVFA